MPENVIKIDRETDLVYSPDDGGYYFQRFVGDPVKDYLSKIYPHKSDAMRDWKENHIKWKPLLSLKEAPHA